MKTGLFFLLIAVSGLLILLALPCMIAVDLLIGAVYDLSTVQQPEIRGEITP
jgi:hypothetical protein